MPRRLVIPIVAIAVLTVLGGGAAGYVYFFSGLRTSPPALSFASPSPTPSAAASPSPSATSTTTTGFAGTWQVASGSLAGYRVKEQFVGQTSTHEAVARTSAVTGQLTITQSGAGYQLAGGTINVDLTGLASIDSVAGYNVTNRDRIVQQSLEVGQFPTATLQLQPVAIPSGAESGQTVSFSVAGNLTVHGVTKAVTVSVQLRVTGGVPQVVASIQTNMTDFGVQPPSIGFTTVQPAVTIEAQLSFTRG
ncbi:MAG TPA: YceI family protein [Candidatus Dormibacteraeota bacterium]|nr:YceI family protein [Candidatus Dormibacteraeota bacterium]